MTELETTKSLLIEKSALLERAETEARDYRQQYEGQSVVLRETHLEIARMDKDIKEVWQRPHGCP